MKCEVCRNELVEDSNYCTSCSNYQDFRRHIFQWSGLLVAFLALLPLFNGAWSLYRIANPDVAKVEIVEVFCTRRQVQIFVKNSGGQEATLRPPSFNVVRGSARSKINLEPTSFPSATNVSAGKMVNVELNFSAPQQLPKRDDRNATCTLETSFPIVGSGEKKPIVGACACPT